MEGSQNSGVSIFISYAREDESLKKELDKHLITLKRSKKVNIWHDRKVLAGEEWDPSIMKELQNADVILLLISIDFIASEYIWENELASAMERHEEGSAKVVPIILRRCEWKSQPYAKIQALPTDAKPVTEHTDKDAAFTDIARGIEKVVDHLLEGSSEDNTSSIAEPEPVLDIPLEDLSLETLGITRSDLLALMNSGLNLAELKQVTFKLKVDFEDLASGNKSIKTMSLIEYAERRSMIPDLLKVIAETYPHVLKS